MKKSYVSSRFLKHAFGLKGLGLVAAFGSAALITACGGKFTPLSSAKAPVVTSDPAAAERERIRQAQLNGETEVSYFNDKDEENAFNTVMNEGTTQFDFEEYAKKLETDPKSNKAVPEFDANDTDPETEGLETKQAPVTSTVEPGGPALPATDKTAEVPHADGSTPAQTVTETKTPEVETHAPSATAENKGSRRQIKRPALAVPAFAKDICAQTNIKSASPENIDALYSDTSALPKDLPSVQLRAMDSVQKQNQFICKLLPHALRMNAEVFAQRIYLSRLQYRSIKGTLTDEDRTWIAGMKKAYRLEEKVALEDLLKRVDIVPLPMLLAQAAVESGWGTSNAVMKANNLFGVHARKGEACVPGFDSEGKACLVKFGSITESVAHYIRLLNRGSAFEDFRELRSTQRKTGHRLDSEKLIDTMKKYSERGADYTVAVKRIMSGHNNLTKYNIDEKKMTTAVQEPTK